MPLGIGSALWAAVIPIAENNLFQNPSYEFGTTGAAAIQSATLGSSSGFQRYGAWSLQVTPNSNGTSGALLGTFTSGNGTTYSVSAWVYAAAGVPMRLGIGDSGGLNLTSGTITFTGGGTWGWYSCTLTEAAQGTRGVVAQKTSGNSVAPFYVDGVKVSPWTDGIDRQTTYLDGDQTGCQWLGAPHLSQSQRSGQYRGGGSIIALADLGLSVDQYIGAGVPPIEDSSQSYAIVDGAEFQRQRAASRKFTLTAKPLFGTSLADFHITRRTLWDAFKPDLVTPQQPVRFLYVGGQGTIQYDAYYESGLELGQMDGPIAELAGVQFAGYNPYWYAPTQQGTSLGLQVNLGSANWIVSRDPLGRWGTLGPSGTSTSHLVLDLAIGTDQKVIVAGSFQKAGGTNSGGLALYDPSSNTWGTFAGGTVDPQLRSIVLAPNGTIYFGGQFSGMAGTTSGSIGYWAGAGYGSFGGHANDQVWSLAMNAAGTLFFGGQFTQIKGTTSPRLAQYFSGAIGSLVGQAGGTVDSDVYGLTIGLDQSLYFGGAFGSAGGTFMSRIGQWKNNAFGTLTTGATAGAGGSFVQPLTTMPNGQIVVGGNFGTIGGVTTQNVGVWNGAGFSPLGQGLGSSDGVHVPVVFASDASGNIYAGGVFTRAGSINLPDGLAKYVGGAWVPFDIDLGQTPSGGTAQVGAIAFSATGTMYVGGVFQGTAVAASVAAVVNIGRAQAYPTLRMRNTSASGTARIYQLLNTTTNDGIYFGLSLLPSEQATLDLTPTNRTFTSSFRGNIFSAILPGSNLATWGLLPGTNYVSFFADVNSGLDVSLYWQPRSWSIDGGTIQ